MKVGDVFKHPAGIEATVDKKHIDQEIYEYCCWEKFDWQEDQLDNLCGDLWFCTGKEAA